MRSLRRPRVVMLSTMLAASAAAMVVAACVGDDPSPGTISGGDAATDTATGNPLDASPGDGAQPPSDGAASDGGDAAPGWTPAALDQANNLALWLEASSSNLVVSSGAVDIWKDLSKNKNDAKDPSGGPTVSAGMAGGGHDSLHFTEGVSLVIDDAASLQFGREQFYVAAVTRYLPASSGSAYLFSKVTTANSGAGAFYGSGFELALGRGQTDAGSVGHFPMAHISATAGNELDWSDAVFDDGKFHLVAVRRINNSALAMSVDDKPVRQIATDAVDVSETGRIAQVGAFHYGNLVPSVDFDLAELVIVHGATAIVADSDVASLHAYLKKKYGL